MSQPHRQLSLVYERALFTRFIQWLEDNPAVWRLFERFTLQAIAAGHTRYSADAICHRIRWHVDIDVRDSHFKINNNHVAFLARYFEERHPECAGFFRQRNQRCA